MGSLKRDPATATPEMWANLDDVRGRLGDDLGPDVCPCVMAMTCPLHRPCPCLRYRSECLCGAA